MSTPTLINFPSTPKTTLDRLTVTNHLSFSRERNGVYEMFRSFKALPAVVFDNLLITPRGVGQENS